MAAMLLSTARPARQGIAMLHTTNRPARLKLIALAVLASLCNPVLAQKVKKDPAAGIEVTVTPEMTGAGMVSSGVTLPPIPPVTGSRTNRAPSWGKPLPYPIVIADRRNNRLIEIAPDKSIVWEFPSPNLKFYRGNEDVNFSADGKQIAVSEEDNFDIHLVDYEKKELTWTYGIPDHRGKGPGLIPRPTPSPPSGEHQASASTIPPSNWPTRMAPRPWKMEICWLPRSRMPGFPA
ncbi:MAG: hypothetical protein IPI80_11130 [Burkholderiales bacterium]|nr:hypothetical protein [Burkholderiales bacterium]